MIEIANGYTFHIMNYYAKFGFNDFIILQPRCEYIFDFQITMTDHL